VKVANCSAGNFRFELAWKSQTRTRQKNGNEGPLKEIPNARAPGWRSEIILQQGL
jgi:hypothetical protein